VEEKVRELSDYNEALEVKVNEKVNELQQAQEQLMQSDKMASIGQLAAGVAHEINNPIGYVNSNLNTLEQYAAGLLNIVDAYQVVESHLDKDSEPIENLVSLKERIDFDYLRQDIMNLIHESQEGANRVKKIVQDLKDFSHVDNNEWQDADLHAGLDSTLNIVHNEIKYKAEVVKEYGRLPTVQCVISQINQVFMNILVNAAQAIENKGVITIRTFEQDGLASIEISDNGKGIDPGNIKKIFDPFFTTKPVGKGTGLGLSLTYSIIKKHGGSIDVESQPGKGTTFRILLPGSQNNEAIEDDQPDRYVVAHG